MGAHTKVKVKRGEVMCNCKTGVVCEECLERNKAVHKGATVPTDRALKAAQDVRRSLDTTEQVRKLREALEPFATFAENYVDPEGWNDVGISASHERIVDWFGPSDFRQARTLAESEAGTECPIPPTTPEEANDILASVGLPPQSLPPPEIARGIVEKWSYDQAEGFLGLEELIIAAIQSERDALLEKVRDAASATVTEFVQAVKTIAPLPANTWTQTWPPEIPLARLVEYVRTAALEAAGQYIPGDLRALGWSVAIHNDYRQDGKFHTFWLLTKSGQCVKGEGESDAEALNQIRVAIRGKGVKG